MGAVQQVQITHQVQMSIFHFTTLGYCNPLDPMNFDHRMEFTIYGWSVLSEVFTSFDDKSSCAVPKLSRLYNRVKMAGSLWWLFVAFILASSDAASIAVDKQLKKDVRRQTPPSPVEFPSGVRLAPVDSFISDDEYIDPNHAGTWLFDSSGISSTNISADFQVSDFLSRNESDAPYQYFRLSPRLIECLQRVHTASGIGVRVISGYRTLSHNNNIPGASDSSRHRSGTAADIQFTDGSSGMALAQHIVDNCVPLFRGYNEDIGLGHYSTHIHVDIRSSFHYWDSNGNNNEWKAWIDKGIGQYTGCYRRGYFFPCRQLNRCVDFSSICNNRLDCGESDHSDELGSPSACGNPASSPPTPSTPSSPPTTSTVSPTTRSSGRGGGCFMPHSMVFTNDPVKPVKLMAELEIGDEVLSTTSDGKLAYSPFIAFLVKVPSDETEFVTLQTEDGNILSLTPSHLIFRNSSSKPVFASSIKPGDYVYSLDKQAPSSLQVQNVTKIGRTKVLGAYAPLTAEGTIVVDNIVASCYGVLEDHQFLHTAFAPLRLLNYLIPSMVGQNQEGLHWYSEIMQAFGKRTFKYIVGDHQAKVHPDCC